jgi:hypothetical protein
MSDLVGEENGRLRQEIAGLQQQQQQQQQQIAGLQQQLQQQQQDNAGVIEEATVVPEPGRFEVVQLTLHDSSEAAFIPDLMTYHMRKRRWFKIENTVAGHRVWKCTVPDHACGYLKGHEVHGKVSLIQCHYHR